MTPHIPETKKGPFQARSLVPAVGLEPTRVISPTDFESVTSANSITPALDSACCAAE